MTTGEEEASSSDQHPTTTTGMASHGGLAGSSSGGNTNSGILSSSSDGSPSMDISANLSYSILPLLQMQPVNNLTKHDIHNLVKTILNMEPYILNFDLSLNGEHIGFFAPFVALSTNCIISNATAIPKSQVQLTSNACSILIQYILHYLQSCNERSILTKVSISANISVGHKLFHRMNNIRFNPSNNFLFVLFQIQLITLLQSLCDDVPPLTKSDIISLCAVIKSSKVPTELSPRQSVESERSHLSTSRSGEGNEDSKEPKRIRLDHTCDLLIEQLMTPIVDLNRRDYSDYEKTVGSHSNFPQTQDSKVSRGDFNCPSTLITFMKH